MFRSRRLGRRLTRLVSTVERPTLRALRQVHRLIDAGQYAQAYPILQRLAEAADQRGMPVRAANLYLEAARARLEMGGTRNVGAAQDGVILAQQAIRLFMSVGQVDRVRALLPRLVNSLREKGYQEQAVALQAETKALLGTDQTVAPPSQRGTLPARCPSCNGPVRSDEVAWIDDQSAECIYCGSVIQTQ